jgi:hypothetical protein
MRFVPAVIAFLLLAAHFMRQADTTPMTACVLAPILLFVRKRWALVAVQWSLYIGSAIWGYTTVLLVLDRMMTQSPWVRTVAILSAFTLFTLYAGRLLNADTVRRNYPEPGDGV